ncbi:MAG: Ig-like domain-containing protein [Chloroflexota bacterium]
MRYRFAFRIAAAVVLALAALVPLTGLAAPPERERVIVVFKDNVGNPSAVANEMSRRHNANVGRVFSHAIKGFSAEVPKQALLGMSRDGRVAFIEHDQMVQTFAEPPTGVDRIEADKNDTANIDGNDDRVDADIAILDTGIDPDHPDLNIAGGVNCTGGFFFPSCQSGGFDDGNGHGTHVAGSAAALDNGSGVVGVAPGARLWAVKVLDDNGSGYMSWIVAGIDWVAANAGTIEVANMSLGCECSSSALDSALSNATDAGTAFVVAAGNSASDAATFSPANHPQVIAVSAMADFNGLPGGGADPTCRTDVDDTFADFSNYGDVVDIAAPGVCIESTWPGGGYNTISGTSMASPHGAGAAALYIVENNIGQSQNRWSTVRTGLQTDWGVPQSDPCGFAEGISDEPFLLLASCEDTGDDPVDNPPSVEITTPTDGEVVSGTVTIEADATDDDTVSEVEFFVDGDSIGIDTDGGDGWSASWDSSGLGDGAEATITATATDSADQSESDSVAVVVNNSGNDDDPAVTITEPSDGDVVAGTITIEADATDDFGVLQVEFFVDGSSIGTDDDGSDGWSVDWDSTSVAEGDHTISATAADGAGQSDSDSVSIAVDNVDDPPTATFTNPLDGDTVSGDVTLAAEASDDRGVVQVEFQVDLVVVGVDTDGSDGWSVPWDSTTIADGSYFFHAIATDTAGQEWGEAIVVTVENGSADADPSVEITSPGDGDTVSGEVEITANASDDNGVDQVEFFVDGASIGTGTESAGTWSINWDTIGYADDAYTITATATDTAGQTASSSVGVTVDNIDEAPSATITNPSGGSTVDGTVAIQVDADDAEDSAGSLDVEVSIDGGTWQSATYSGGFYEFDWDTTTVADGDYTIDARASDSGGNVTNATQITVTVSNAPDEPSDPQVIHIGDLDGSNQNNGRTWDAIVSILVVDDQGNAIEGAVVSGDWGSPVNGSASCTTGSDGRCTVDAGNILKRNGTVSFTVTDVDGPLPYDANSNTDPDGDSDGTTIVVSK